MPIPPEEMKRKFYEIADRYASVEEHLHPAAPRLREDDFLILYKAWLNGSSIKNVAQTLRIVTDEKHAAVLDELLQSPEDFLKDFEGDLSVYEEHGYLRKKPELRLIKMKNEVKRKSTESDGIVIQSIGIDENRRRYNAGGLRLVDGKTAEELPPSFFGDIDIHEKLEKETGTKLV